MPLIFALVHHLPENFYFFDKGEKVEASMSYGLNLWFYELFYLRNYQIKSFDLSRIWLVFNLRKIK